MTCINIVDHRRQGSCLNCDAVIEVVSEPGASSLGDLVHNHKILNETTVERAVCLAQRVPAPVVLFLYTSGTIQRD
jgi:hypothetical protein